MRKWLIYSYGNHANLYGSWWPQGMKLCKLKNLLWPIAGVESVLICQPCPFKLIFYSSPLSSQRVTLHCVHPVSFNWWEVPTRDWRVEGERGLGMSFLIFNFLIIFIVVWKLLSTFSHHRFPQLHSPPSPTLHPNPLGFVHGSVIHAPWWPFLTCSFLTLEPHSGSTRMLSWLQNLPALPFLRLQPYCIPATYFLSFTLQD